MKNSSISLLLKWHRKKHYLLETWNFDSVEKIDLLNTYGRGNTVGKQKAGAEQVNANMLYNTIFWMHTLSRDSVCNCQQALDLLNFLRTYGFPLQGILPTNRSVGSKLLSKEQITEDRCKIVSPKVILQRLDHHIS